MGTLQEHGPAFFVFEETYLPYAWSSRFVRAFEAKQNRKKYWAAVA